MLYLIQQLCTPIRNVSYELSVICETVTAHRHEGRVLWLYALVLPHTDYVNVTIKFYSISMLVTWSCSGLFLLLLYVCILRPIWECLWILIPAIKICFVVSVWFLLLCFRFFWVPASTIDQSFLVGEPQGRGTSSVWRDTQRHRTRFLTLS